MQTSIYDSQCNICSKQIKQDEKMYCRPCYDLIPHRLNQAKAQTEMLETFLALELPKEEADSQGQNINQISRQLKKLEEQQFQLELELKRIMKSNDELEAGNASSLNTFFSEVQQKDKSSNIICERLSQAEALNTRLTEELEGIKKVKVLQSFFELQVNKFNYYCTFDGIKLSYENLSIVLPILSHILKCIVPKGYQKKCISEIYLDQSIIIVFEVKDGKKCRDREVSVAQNASTWVSYLINQLQDVNKFFKIGQKFGFASVEIEKEKESIFFVCKSLKLASESLDDLYFEF